MLVHCYIQRYNSQNVFQLYNSGKYLLMIIIFFGTCRLQSLNQELTSGEESKAKAAFLKEVCSIVYTQRSKEMPTNP